MSGNGVTIVADVKINKFFDDTNVTVVADVKINEFFDDLFVPVNGTFSNQDVFEDVHESTRSANICNQNTANRDIFDTDMFSTVVEGDLASSEHGNGNFTNHNLSGDNIVNIKSFEDCGVGSPDMSETLKRKCRDPLLKFSNPKQPKYDYADDFFNLLSGKSPTHGDELPVSKNENAQYFSSGAEFKQSTVFDLDKTEGSMDRLKNRKCSRNKTADSWHNYLQLSDSLYYDSGLPPVETNLPSVIAEIPPVVNKNSCAETKIPYSVTETVVTELPPGVTEIPLLVAELQPLITDIPPELTEIQPGVAEIPPIVTEISPLITKIPHVTEIPPWLMEIPPLAAEIPPEFKETQPWETEIKPFVTEITPKFTEIAPEFTENPPLITDIPPELTEIQPGVAEIPPMVTEFSPLVTKITHVTEIPPWLMEIPPLAAEIPPEFKETQPWETEIEPLVTEITPKFTEIPPLVTENPPLITENSPVVIKAVPMITDIPQVMAEIPTKQSADDLGLYDIFSEKSDHSFSPPDVESHFDVTNKHMSNKALENTMRDPDIGTNDISDMFSDFFSEMELEDLCPGESTLLGRTDSFNDLPSWCMPHSDKNNTRPCVVTDVPEVITSAVSEDIFGGENFEIDCVNLNNLQSPSEKSKTSRAENTGIPATCNYCPDRRMYDITRKLFNNTGNFLSMMSQCIPVLFTPKQSCIENSNQAPPVEAESVPTDLHLLDRHFVQSCDGKDGYKPKHFTIASLQIGQFKYTSNDYDPHKPAKLKIIFSQRKILYELQINKLQIAESTGMRKMALIEVSFGSVIGMSGQKKDICLNIGSPPMIFLGSQILSSHPEFSPKYHAQFDHSKEEDITAGQVKTATHHLIQLVSGCADRVLISLRTFDNRFSLQCRLPIITKIGLLQTDRQLKKIEEQINSTSSNIRTSVPTRRGCCCKKGCRNGRCYCCKHEEPCMKTCRCQNCCNPLNMFQKLGITIEAAKIDSCLMQNIYKIDNVRLLLASKVMLGCCQIRISIRQCVPGTITCPNSPTCKYHFKYSWCMDKLCDENTDPRHHCALCKKCTNNTGHHCQECLKCSYPTNDRPGQCQTYEKDGDITD